MNTPIVLFMFKRKDTLLQIISKVRVANPKKIYLISDQGRNHDEQKQVDDVRRAVESAIDWKCEIVRDYAETNRGVYGNIGLGALRVFANEDRAIFLEDDNFPNKTFFQYCEQMLDLYEKDEQVLWICGTNYYKSIEDDENYYFTQHLLPCGWASWANKFVKNYDKDLLLLSDDKAMKRFKKSYENRALYRQQLRDIVDERNRKQLGKAYSSWDYHMLLSIRARGLFGIMPANNQIRNIGDDINSIHGGTNMDKVMTSRFCQVETKCFKFPIEKKTVKKNSKVEKMIEKKILYPLKLRIRVSANRMIKNFFRIPFDKSLREIVYKRRIG